MKVSNVIEGKAQFGDVHKQLVFFDVEDDSKEESFERMHCVHILDRSGSMSPHIGALIEDVKKTLQYMDPEDYLTVLWFASAGDYRTVLKGVKAKEKDSIFQILDSLKSTRGCTCFSEPLAELNTIIEETKPMCSTFNVTLFTDGEPVTPWPEYEEISRIFENLEKLENKVVAFNAIGYGQYYNKDLLLRMTKTSEYGVLSHASRIDDYHVIFSHNKSVIENIAGKRMKIEALHAHKVDIVGLTTKTVKFGRIDHSKTNPDAEEVFSIRLAKNKNRYMLVFAENADTEFIMNGEKYCADDTYFDRHGIVTENAQSLYAYAYKLFENGQKRDALDVLAYIGDGHLYNKVLNTFTHLEVGEMLEFMKTAIFIPEFQDILKVDIVTPEKDAYCVLDLLQDLVNAKAMYKVTQNYCRISRKKVDEFNLFEADDCDNWSELSDLVVNQDRLNVSVRFRLPGKVKLNPNRAKQVGLPTEVPACIYRNHAFIKDGEINITDITVACSKEVIEVLKKLPKDSYFVESDGENETAIISLTYFPVINAQFLDIATADTVFDIENSMLNMEAQNKYLNTVITEEEKFESSVKTDYTPEQIAVLMEHGMKTSGVYNSIAPVQQEAEDYIYIRECRTMLKGFSSLPTFAKVHEKQEAKKKLTPGEALLAKYEDALKGSAKESLLSLKKANKESLKDLRFKLAGIKLASILSGSKIGGLEQQEDGTYTFTKNDQTLIVKYERKQVAI